MEPRRRQALPTHFMAETEKKITTTMGSFTVYPGDEVDTVDPVSLVVRRDNHHFHIAWDIIADLQF